MGITLSAGDDDERQMLSIMNIMTAAQLKTAVVLFYEKSYEAACRHVGIDPFVQLSDEFKGPIMQLHTLMMKYPVTFVDSAMKYLLGKSVFRLAEALDSTSEKTRISTAKYIIDKYQSRANKTGATVRARGRRKYMVGFDPAVDFPDKEEIEIEIEREITLE